MKPKFYIAAMLVFAGTALWTGNAAAEEGEGVCSSNAALAADDPDCADPYQGRQCAYADTSGHAETCDNAETCDTAAHCEYADTCGDAATCDQAGTCTTADHAQTCDQAGFADTCGSTATADVANSVGECVTGVFSVGGAPSPSCGDLRYDGRLGINTDPTATLDVAGSVALRGAPGGMGLHVANDGKVGIGTDIPTESLEVVGTVIADRFVAAPQTRTHTILPATDCRVGDISLVNGFGKVTFDTLRCGASIESDAIVTSISCRGEGTVDITVLQQDGTFDDDGTWTGSGDLATGANVSVNNALPVARGGSLSITLSSTGTSDAVLHGCLITYEATAWK